MSNAVLKVVRSHQAVGGADLEIRGPSNGFQGHPDSIKPATCPPWTSEPRTLRTQRATWENRKVWEKWGPLCRGMVSPSFFGGGRKKGPGTLSDHLGSVQKPCWLMINWWLTVRGSVIQYTLQKNNCYQTTSTKGQKRVLSTAHLITTYHMYSVYKWSRINTHLARIFIRDGTGTASTTLELQRDGISWNIYDLIIFNWSI